MDPYMEQFERVKRWLNKIQTPNRNKEEFVDFLWAFFQNCWHLKDWICNDPLASAKWASAGDDALKCDSLWLTQGLANRTKHLVLNRSRQSKSQVIEVISVNIPKETTYRYRVFNEKRNRWDDILNLAQEAVKDWEKMLKSHGLL